MSWPSHFAGSPGPAAVTAYPWAGSAAQGYVPVGYQNEPSYPGSLTDGSGLTIQSGLTYKYYANPGGGSIGTSASPVSNVTFTGCAFDSANATGVATSDVSTCNLFGTNISFSYCTFQPGPLSSWPPSSSNSAVPQTTGPQWGFVADGSQASPGTFSTWVLGLSVDHCDFWGFGNGAARLGNNAATASYPNTVSYAWCHNNRLNTNGLDHQDGFGCPGGTGTPGGISWLTMTGCQVNGAGDTNAIVWGSGPAAVANCTFSGNLFGGYGFTIHLDNTGNQISNLTFTGNTFSTLDQCVYGPLYDTSLLSSTGFLWRGNKWWVPPGAYWGHTAYSGYYWLPGYTSNAAPGFDELLHGLVGTTDYM